MMHNMFNAKMVIVGLAAFVGELQTFNNHN